MTTHSDAYLKISTPENVAFGYEVAGLGSRFMAAAIDTICLVLIQVIVFLAVGLLLNAFDILVNININWIIALSTILFFLMFWGFYILFELIWNGQTPGKRLFNLRVIRTDGAPIGFVESLIRNLVRIIDFIPSFYGLGVSVMFFNMQSRRLGDFAANTLVVHDRNISLESLGKATQTPSYEIDADMMLGLPVERLQEKDVVLAEEFLLRREGLTNATGLVRPILTRLYTQMEMPAPDKMRYNEAVTLLRTIVQARRASGGVSSYSEGKNS